MQYEKMIDPGKWAQRVISTPSDVSYQLQARMTWLHVQPGSLAGLLTITSGMSLQMPVQ